MDRAKSAPSQTSLHTNLLSFFFPFGLGISLFTESEISNINWQINMTSSLSVLCCVQSLLNAANTLFYPVKLLICALSASFVIQIEC